MVGFGWYTDLGNPLPYGIMDVDQSIVGSSLSGTIAHDGEEVIHDLTRCGWVILQVAVVEHWSSKLIVFCWDQIPSCTHYHQTERPGHELLV